MAILSFDLVVVVSDCIDIVRLGALPVLTLGIDRLTSSERSLICTFMSFLRLLVVPHTVLMDREGRVRRETARQAAEALRSCLPVE